MEERGVPFLILAPSLVCGGSTLGYHIEPTSGIGYQLLCKVILTVYLQGGKGEISHVYAHRGKPLLLYQLNYILVTFVRADVEQKRKHV